LAYDFGMDAVISLRFWQLVIVASLPSVVWLGSCVLQWRSVNRSCDRDERARRFDPERDAAMCAEREAEIARMKEERNELQRRYGLPLT
jgi:hypothetical protein